MKAYVLMIGIGVEDHEFMGVFTSEDKLMEK